jgi:hypothetical protein
MTPVFGNHIGVVVNNVDPEARNRLQIFVPYISTTLFLGWNSKASDIVLTQGSLAGMGQDIQERLKLILPWAEAAMPLFGSGGTTHADLSTGKTKLSLPPTSKLVSTGNRNTIVRSDDEVISPYGGTPGLLNLNSTDPADVNVMRYLASLGAAETGFESKYMDSNKITDNGFYLDSNGEKVLVTDSNDLKYNSNVYKGVTEEGLSLDNSIARYGDFGYYKTNYEQQQMFTNKLKSAGYGSSLTLNTGSASEQTQKMALYLQLQYPTAYQAIQNGDYKAANDVLRGAWPSLPGGKSWNKFTDSQKKQFISAIQNGNNDSYISKLKDTTSSLDNFPNTVSGSENTGAGPVLKHLDSTTQQRGLDARTPNGINSVPEPGTFVWVFFLGGDVQKPVYFAGVTEKNAGARNTLNPNQIPYSAPAASSTLNTSQDLTIGLGGEFGTKLADTALNLYNTGGNVGENGQYDRDGSHCWAGVKTALQPLIGSYLGGAAANDAPPELLSHGFELVTDGTQRVGDVRVFNGGQYGHVDIVTNQGYVSDVLRKADPTYQLQGVYRYKSG